MDKDCKKRYSEDRVQSTGRHLPLLLSPAESDPRGDAKCLSLPRPPKGQSRMHRDLSPHPNIPRHLMRNALRRLRFTAESAGSHCFWLYPSQGFSQGFSLNMHEITFNYKFNVNECNQVIRMCDICSPVVLYF